MQCTEPELERSATEQFSKRKRPRRRDRKVRTAAKKSAVKFSSQHRLWRKGDYGSDATGQRDPNDSEQKFPLHGDLP
jgi:hypothetical protein